MDKKEKKIKLIIFPGNFLPHVGGLETHIDELSKFLSKNKRYDITIFTPRIAGGKVKEKIHDGVKVIRYPAFEIVSNFPFPKFWSLSFWKLFFGLYKKNYDIAMTRTRFFSNSTLGMFFAKFRFKRLKLIHGEHGSEFVSVESKFTNAVSYVYDKILGNLIFMLSDKIVPVSEIAEDFVEREFFRRNEVRVIRRGIDFSKYKGVKPDKETEEKFKGKIKITIVTRLYKWKGVPNIIDAYKKLPDNVREKCVLLIGGYGEDFDAIEKRSGEYLNKGIYLYGKIPFERAAAIMKASDIYVHSSFPGGGQSSSLLMGMYCKCAVVASPHEGAKETLERRDAGILLKSNSAKSIEKGILELVEDKKLREKYSQNAYELMIEEYDWRDVVRKYDKLFDDVLK